MLKAKLNSIMKAVAKIIPIIAGRMERKVTLTPAYLSVIENIVATSKIIINDGKITPSVARKEPKIPACEDPIKVAIFIATGPGVLSATAIKFNISELVSQPCAKTSSVSNGIIAYPPPNVNKPSLKKVKNKSR